MPGISNAIGIPFQSGGGTDWSSYWATLISATVEDATPTHVVLTFPDEGTSVAADITATVNGVARVVSSASWTGGVWTVVLASAIEYGDVVVMTFVPSGGTANVTNNVAAEAELTTYITGLTTPLSLGQKLRINEFIKTLKTGLSITNLSDTFDVFYILAGETEESSLKNLIKNAHHGTLAGSPAPVFTQYEGFIGNGSSAYINCNYNTATQAVRFATNNFSIGFYSRTSYNNSGQLFGTSGAGGTHPININVAATTSTAMAYPSMYTHIDINHASVHSGTLVLTRTAANLSNFYIRSLNVSTAQAQSGWAATSAYLLCTSGNGTPGGFSRDQWSMALFGKGLTGAEYAVVRDAFEDYMDANGKGVINP